MPKFVEITVNRLPLSLNDMVGVHWTKLLPIKETWKELIGYEWISRGRIVFLKPVQITYTIFFKDNRLRDFDNYLGGTKFINDALRHTFITRDDHRWLKKLNTEFEIDRQRAYTKIRIEEVLEDV